MEKITKKWEGGQGPENYGTGLDQEGEAEAVSGAEEHKVQGLVQQLAAGQHQATIFGHIHHAGSVQFHQI